MASPVPALRNEPETTVISKIPSVETARKLPRGSVVGDGHGGVTFTDAVAAILESRSNQGWKEVELAGKLWTVIVLDR